MPSIGCRLKVQKLKILLVTREAFWRIGGTRHGRAVLLRFGLWRFVNVRGTVSGFLSRQCIGFLVLRFGYSSEEGCVDVHLTPNGVDSWTY